MAKKKTARKSRKEILPDIGKRMSLNRFFAEQRDLINDEMEAVIPDAMEDVLQNPTGSYQRATNRIIYRLDTINKNTKETNKNVTYIKDYIDKDLKKTLKKLDADIQNSGGSGLLDTVLGAGAGALTTAGAAAGAAGGTAAGALKNAFKMGARGAKSLAIPALGGLLTHYADKDTSKAGNSTVGSWINENIPGAAAIDDFTYRMTGGWVGTDINDPRYSWNQKKKSDDIATQTFNQITGSDEQNLDDVNVKGRNISFKGETITFDAANFEFLYKGQTIGSGSSTQAGQAVAPMLGGMGTTVTGGAAAGGISAGPAGMSFGPNATSNASSAPGAPAPGTPMSASSSSGPAGQAGAPTANPMPTQVGTFSGTADATAARKNAEAYLGRPMSDQEYDYLIRATHAEAAAGKKADPREQGMIMASILNRARDEGENGVIKALEKKNQFQSVTGTKYSPGPSSNFSQGPGTDRLTSIQNSTAMLQSIPHEQKNFTAAASEAYGPGTNIGYRDNMLAQGGTVIGGSVFNTTPNLPTATQTIDSSTGQTNTSTYGSTLSSQNAALASGQIPGTSPGQTYSPSQGSPLAGDPNTVIDSNSPIWDTINPDLAKYKDEILGGGGGGRTGKISLGALQAADAVFKQAANEGVKMRVATGGGSNSHSENHGAIGSGIGESLDIKPINGWQPGQAERYAITAGKAGANRIGVPTNGSGLHVQRSVPTQLGGSGRPDMSWGYGPGAGNYGKGSDFRKKWISGEIRKPDIMPNQTATATPAQPQQTSSTGPGYGPTQAPNSPPEGVASPLQAQAQPQQNIVPAPVQPVQAVPTPVPAPTRMVQTMLSEPPAVDQLSGQLQAMMNTLMAKSSPQIQPTQPSINVLPHQNRSAMPLAAIRQNAQALGLSLPSIGGDNVFGAAALTLAGETGLLQ